MHAWWIRSFVYFSVVLCALAQTEAAAKRAASDSPQAVLIDVLQRMPQQAIRYVETSIRFGSDRTDVTVDQIWQRPGGFWRIERQSSKLDDGLILVITPTTLFIGVKGLPLVYVHKSEPDQERPSYPGSMLVRHLLEHMADVRFDPVTHTVFAGRPTQVIRGAFVRGGWAVLWVDSATKLVVREERYDALQNPVEIVVRSEIDFSPNLEPSLFTLAAPPGGSLTFDEGLWQQKVLQLRLLPRVPFRALIPTDPPLGYHLDGADVLIQGNEPVAVMRFAKGKHTLSIYQRLARPSTPSGLRGAVLEGVATFTQRMGEVEVTVVGHLTATEARQVFSLLKAPAD